MASENPSEAADAAKEGTPEPSAIADARQPSVAPVEAGPTTDPTAAPSEEADDARPAEARTEARDGARRVRFENMLPSLIRRGIEKSIEAGLSTFEKSVETGRETTGAVREVFQEVKDVKIPREVASAVGKALSEAKLPRDIASAVFGQIDETKNDVLRIVAREFRDFLEATDLASELKKALTSLSFEVRTEVRFIPNDAGDGVKADVRSRTRVKRAPSPRERGLRRSKAQPKQPDPEDHDDSDEDLS